MLSCGHTRANVFQRFCHTCGAEDTSVASWSIEWQGSALRWGWDVGAAGVRSPAWVLSSCSVELCEFGRIRHALTGEGWYWWKHGEECVRNIQFMELNHCVLALVAAVKASKK